MIRSGKCSGKISLWSKKYRLPTRAKNSPNLSGMSISVIYKEIKTAKRVFVSLDRKLKTFQRDKLFSSLSTRSPGCGGGHGGWGGGVQSPFYPPPLPFMFEGVRKQIDVWINLIDLIRRFKISKRINWWGFVFVRAVGLADAFQHILNKTKVAQTCWLRSCGADFIWRQWR